MDNAPNWPDRRLLDLLDLDHPIIQAPITGAASLAPRGWAEARQQIRPRRKRFVVGLYFPQYQLCAS